MSSRRDFIITEGVIEEYIGDSEEIRIPPGVIDIEIYAFEDCRSLRDISIPESVEMFGAFAFRNCTRLRNRPVTDDPVSNPALDDSVNRPEEAREVDDETAEIDNADVPYYLLPPDPDGFVIVDGVLFYYRGNAKEVVIPDGVTRIGASVFDKCTSVTSFVIPDSVEIIDAYAFSRCIRLQSIRIPDSVTRLHRTAFAECRNLRQIILPEHLPPVTPCRVKMQLEMAMDFWISTAG